VSLESQGLGFAVFKSDDKKFVMLNCNLILHIRLMLGNLHNALIALYGYAATPLINIFNLWMRKVRPREAK
jgi:hypothetical protein